MDAKKTRTRTLNRTQRRFSVYPQQMPKAMDQQQQIQKQEIVQQQPLSQEQEQDQKGQHQYEELQQELDLDQDLEPEQEQTEGPQLITEPSLAAEKVSRHSQTKKEQNFWYWVPRRTDDSPWECLVKGKGQEILEAIFSSKSTCHDETVSSQQGGTTQTTETAQHGTHSRTTLTQPRAQSSNPGHEVRTTGMQHRCQHSVDQVHEARPMGMLHRFLHPVAFAGCSNYAPGIRNFCQRGIPHVRMPAPQMFPSEMQPARNVGLHPATHSCFGVAAPAQNSATHQQQSTNANFQPLSLDASVNETLATLKEIITGALMLHERRSELTPGQIRGKIRGIFQQIFAEPGNRPQQ